MSGQSGSQGRVWCQGPCHLQQEVGIWGILVQPQPWAGRAGLCGAGELLLCQGPGADGPCRLTQGSVLQAGWGEVREGRGTVRRDGALGLTELSRNRQISINTPILTLRKLKPDILQSTERKLHCICSG